MSDLSDVREGMDVFDASGEKVGTVKSVKFGDPQATTAEGQTFEREPNIVQAVATALSGQTDLPEERRERLLRLGYVEVDGKGFGNNFFEGSDAVKRVSGNTVYLNHSS
ncbi:PRC-barrel domain-containing protein [Arthrobacter sp. VKM Ac-2550]|uniref:PRC-barrel domain-containing protein n=1 Tax=Crystallibacter permensis TaxID=1938888 RepID=UPI002227F40B|nr:PRC-barrel domain-containing protein [Arthrobacter sp. VKM Ac-2550]MCW2131491.1 hypothetical protein [Arthrobacter sp. VKM Ac-2550]